MDPENGDSGFHRSIVLKRGLASTDVLRNARGNASRSAVPRIDPAELVPSLAGTGLAIKTPRLPRNAAGRPLWYRIPYTIADRDQLPDDLQASVRWDPLDPDAAPADPEARPDFGLVMAERVGDVVAPVGLEVIEEVPVGQGHRPGRARSLPAVGHAPRQGRRGVR